MKFSIIVPVYNAAAFLNETVASVLQQSCADWELLLVDDGSTDGVTGKLCDEIAAQDERIRTIHKPNGGAGDARNAAFPYASGDYIVFLDSDDFFEPNALSWWFADESEACATFETYMTLAATLEKKETFEGVGYPWLKVHLTRSDAAHNACRLARMIGDDALIDRACGVLKLVDSERRYGAAIFLTGLHRTDTQRQVFFGLICDRDPGMRAIHRRKHTSKYQPVAADAPVLEALLTTRYDDAREELLRLLGRLPPEALAQSIARLCASRKEELRKAGETLRSLSCPVISPD